ncbi:unnamed protein product [Peniophora sp. CBMAI 1063]|nr:unnamed protein product [Peniophora sp. CBMAI 1063]
MAFLQLPLEILSIILGALGVQDLLRCGETCQVLHTAVSNIPTLQYILALSAYGLVDNVSNTKPITEKLERARLTYRAYRDFRWIPHLAISLDGQYIEQPSSPMVLRSATSTRLTLMLFGSLVRDAPDRQWTVNPQPAAAFSRTINVSEDLLVLQTQNIQGSCFHIRTVSDGAAHPQAALPSFPGGVLGVAHQSYGPYLLMPGANNVHTIWNWKTGMVVSAIRCHYSAIAFLDAEHIALLCLTDLGQFMHVYHLPSIIFDVNAGIMHPPQYAFGLPTLDPAVMPLACSLLRGPASPYATAGSPTPTGTCYTDPEDVLLMVKYEQVLPRRQYALAIRLRSLLQLLTPAHMTHTTPWGEWGPRHAHAFRLSQRRTSDWDKHSIFGMRRVDMYPTVTPAGILVVAIRDYHKRRVALARQETPPENGSWILVEEGNLDGAWLGMNTLDTCMPYVETTVPLPPELQSQRNAAIVLSINDDGIIASTGFVGSNATIAHVYALRLRLSVYFSSHTMYEAPLCIRYVLYLHYEI